MPGKSMRSAVMVAAAIQNPKQRCVIMTTNPRRVIANLRLYFPGRWFVITTYSSGITGIVPWTKPSISSR